MLSSQRGRTRISSALLYLILGVLVFVTLIPVIWMVSASLQTQPELSGPSIHWLPLDPQFNNYTDAYETLGLTRYIINSLIVSSAITVGHVLLASMAGYGLAKYRFVGQRWVLLTILATLMLPIEIIMVPLYLIVKDIGWLNSFQGLIVPLIADAFGVFLMRQYFLSLPDSLIDAARVDGAGHFRTFFAIALPLARPAMATLAIYMFRETWDSFLWPLLVVTDNKLRTLPLVLQAFQQQDQANYPQVLAISTLATVPTAVIFFIFQREFVRGIAMTGLKE